MVRAVIFDLDGVLTLTAAVHAAAWKRLFDRFLAERAARLGAPFVAFDPAEDYLTWVDGKPRRDGVRSFLASRGIVLPEGSPGDPEDALTVHGLARRKDRWFREALAYYGVEVDPGGAPLVRGLRALGVAVGVASSSRNCLPVLERAGLRSSFDAIVDGAEIARLGLRGKPAPDMFLEVLRRLGLDEPGDAAIVEDAIAGVAAGRAGGFGLVVGVDRAGQRGRLLASGADLVVDGLSELTPERMDRAHRAASAARGSAPPPDERSRSPSSPEDDRADLSTPGR